jgi:hypothetical protein
MGCALTNWLVMVADVRVAVAQRTIFAAVRRKVTIGHVGAAWRPALVRSGPF